MQIVGTSNVKYLSLKYIAGTEFNMSKEVKYTLKETKDYFEASESKDHQDAFILQSLCNDIQMKSADECTKELTDIIDAIESKHKDSRIIISLGLPRDDVTLNRKVEKINVLLKESLAGRKTVNICDNSNLFYRGTAQQGILKEDGLHLTKDGTKMLAKNIRETLYDMFDIPIITYDSRERDTPQTHSPKHRDNGYEEKKQGYGYSYRKGAATERGRVTIIEGGTATDGNTIISETGDLTMHTGGTIGRMITSISADKIRLSRVAGIGTVMISDVRGDHILLTMNRDMMTGDNNSNA